MRINDLLIQGIKLVDKMARDYRFTLHSVLVIEPYTQERTIRFKCKLVNHLQEVWNVEAKVKDTGGFAVLEESIVTKGETPF